MLRVQEFLAGLSSVRVVAHCFDRPSAGSQHATIARAALSGRCLQWSFRRQVSTGETERCAMNSLVELIAKQLISGGQTGG